MMFHPYDSLHPFIKLRTKFQIQEDIEQEFGIF